MADAAEEDDRVTTRTLEGPLLMLEVRASVTCTGSDETHRRGALAPDAHAGQSAAERDGQEERGAPKGAPSAFLVGLSGRVCNLGAGGWDTLAPVTHGAERQAD